MKWFTQLFNSTLGYKVLMALTGLFLIVFLAVHLVGNLQLLKDDGGKAFNVYAEFMSTNPLIQFVSKGNFAFIIIHAIWAILLTRKNAKARGPEGYAVKSGKSSHWTSRNMGILGTLILVFIVTHLYHFWAQMHGYWGSITTLDYEGKPTRDLYTLVDMWFQKEWYVGLYVFCMGAIAFHLWHGFSSAFQTLGMNHLKYNNLIAIIGRAYAIIIPALFALIPIMMYLND